MPRRAACAATVAAGGRPGQAAGEAAHNATFGVTAAYQRIFAGLLFVVLWFFFLRLLRRLPAAPAQSKPGTAAAGWMVANGLAALTLFSTPPVVLVAIVIATTGRADRADPR